MSVPAAGSDEDQKTSDYLFIDVATDEAGNPILEAEYAGYDDNGTPEDESDDNHLYYIRRYKLREALVPLDNDGDVWENEDPVNGIDDDGDGAVDEDPEDYQPLRNASEGWIRLYYVEDLEKLAEWAIPSLLCVEHGANDGLLTSTEGMQHSVLVKVPVGLMDKAGEYRFVISAKDSHADREKGHREKWALERNSKYKFQALHVWIDGYTGQRQDIVDRPFWPHIRYCFSTVAGIRVVFHRPGVDGFTSGPQSEAVFGGWSSVPFNTLTPAQQAKSGRRTIIVTTTTQVSPGKWIESIAKTSVTDDTTAPPDNPRVIAVNLNNLIGIFEPEPANSTEENWALTNILIHELTHATNDVSGHCTTSPPTPATCIWIAGVNGDFLMSMLTHWVPQPKRVKPPFPGGAWSPWHTLQEINDIRSSMEWPTW